MSRAESHVTPSKARNTSILHFFGSETKTIFKTSTFFSSLLKENNTFFYYILFFISLLAIFGLHFDNSDVSCGGNLSARQKSLPN